MPLLRHFLYDHPASTDSYTLSLHDALPISTSLSPEGRRRHEADLLAAYHRALADHGVTGYALDECWEDRKSTRLNSSHLGISYAVFCLKKKTNRRNAGSTTTSAVASLIS